ncbi:unnamed protein product [Echinostoma caproni]|uniref:Potassium channel domain-containing protein n=1 Tax=Echinostoma caproni TaxID=27848 RepID=A0A3P8FKA2_9TREM|nr:unnamed protein product [Echinostoma caproni]
MYALVGIPLVFLYLSNIGDYLADVFRALYSRTCRTTCERFCSFSILASIFRSLARPEHIPTDIMEAEEPLPRMNEPIAHAHYRRKKRVLLKKICRVDPVVDGDSPELGSDEIPERSVEDGVLKTKTDKKSEQQQQPSYISSNLRKLYQRMRELLSPKSPKVEEMVKINAEHSSNHCYPVGEAATGLVFL